MTLSLNPNDYPDFMKARPSLLRELGRIRWIDPEDLFPMFLVREMETPGEGAKRLRTFVSRSFHHAYVEQNARILAASRF